MQRYKFIDENKEHLHTLDGKPLKGTTTVLNVLAKTLTWWASGLAVAELGWIKKVDERESTKEEVIANGIARLNAAEKKRVEISNMAVLPYLALLDKAYKAHSVKLDKSADKGTDMHSYLEMYVKECIEKLGGVPCLVEKPEVPAVSLFAEWAVKNVKRFLASEGHGYNERLWVGGKFDLLYEDNEGRLVILDFKSAKQAYMSHFLQCAGNDLQISDSGVLDKDGNELIKLEKSIAYYGVFPFGMAKPEPQFYFDVESAKIGFEACVTLDKIINK